ncbi:UNVERIFIED_CONTAM: IAA-amino acid hydrolase ILR1-like 2 [Sesamum radiatum]|uniref:IAA-amino acid hydrolase ILR1-like 2 n=1 Tax=Sesamum radiatum TaxID=300843 RepID=A0AAW2N030_SESRA
MGLFQDRLGVLIIVVSAALSLFMQLADGDVCLNPFLHGRNSSLVSYAKELANEPETVEWMVNIRREIHKNPELAFEEFDTSSLIRLELDKMGIEYRWPVARTGVVATVGSGSPPL